MATQTFDAAFRTSGTQEQLLVSKDVIQSESRCKARRFFVITSVAEPFQNAATLLSTDARNLGLQSTIIDVTALREHHLLLGGRFETTLFYFLTNSPEIPSIVPGLLLNGHTVINAQFYGLALSKPRVQCLLRARGWRVPDMIYPASASQLTHPDFTQRLSFPLFVKSVRHFHFTHEVRTAQALADTIESISVADEFYVEAAVNSKDTELRRFYVVGDAVHDSAGIVRDSALCHYASSLGRVLGLDVYSLEAFVGSAPPVCIDVNPASALYVSAQARARLCERALA
jgi:hypothetical protein